MKHLKNASGSSLFPRAAVPGKGKEARTLPSLHASPSTVDALQMVVMLLCPSCMFVCMRAWDEVSVGKKDPICPAVFIFLRQMGKSSFQT